MGSLLCLCVGVVTGSVHNMAGSSLGARNSLLSMILANLSSLYQLNEL